MADHPIEATELAVAPLALASTGFSDPSASPGATEENAPSPERLAEGTPERVGRYLVLRKLGAGAMGMVVVGYDPELDRKLAIKLIHPRVAKRGEARSRMLREAKGLARLSHPNVVQVYDAGAIDGRVFIAMELVDGQPLSAWCKAQERTTDEILAVFLAAGRGLAAAHDAGLVHRDFKPDNVLVDHEGRARVLDFGLVRAAGDGESREHSDAHPTALPSEGIADTHESGPITREREQESTGGRSSELEQELTHGGQIMGTPAYMSPEQWKGAKADARSDQFSFCVALWEALYGDRPFQGRTIHALAIAIDSGSFTEPESAVRLPRRVRKAIERGLSADPARRFENMRALLRELGREDWSGRSIPLAIVALAAFGLMAWSHFVSVEQPAGPSCAGAGSEVSEIWNPARHDAIRTAFVANRVAGSDAILAQVVRDLDDYTDRWALAAEENCAATRIRQQQSDELFDLRARCLDTKLTELAALVEVLARADASTVEEAVLAVESLPSLSACEPDRVGDQNQALPNDPELAARVTEARRALAGVRASLDTGRFSEAGELLETLEPEVEVLDFPQLTAAFALEQGRLHARLDRYEQAAVDLQKSYFLATQLRDHDLSLTAAVWLAELEGAQRQRPEFARLWAAQAEALLARDPSRYPEFAADLADTNSWNAYLANDLQTARHEAERGLSILDQAELDAPMRRMALLLDLGAAEYGAGDLAAAQSSFEGALELAEATVGRDNAKATGALNNLAFTYMAAGEPERARELLEESATVRERALGPDNATVGNALSNLADVEIELGHGKAALAAAERAHRILNGSLGPDQFATVIARQRLGLALALVGRYQPSLTELRAAREVAAAPPEPDPSLTIELTAQIAAVAAAAGEAETTQNELETVANSDPALWSELVVAGRFAATLAQNSVAESLLTRAIELAGGPADAASRRRLAVAKLTLAKLWVATEPTRASTLLSDDIEDDLRSAPKLAEQLERLQLDSVD
jgi:serine/threonine protein kinase